MMKFKRLRFKVLNISEASSKTTIVSDGGKEFTVPFKVGELNSFVYIGYREKSNKSPEFSQLESNIWNFCLDDEYEFRLIRKNEIKLYSGPKYKIYFLDKNDNEFNTYVNRHQFRNLKEGNTYLFRVIKITPARITFCLTSDLIPDIFKTSSEVTCVIKNKYLKENSRDIAIFELAVSDYIFEKSVSYWQFFYYNIGDNIKYSLSVDGKIEQLYKKDMHPIFEISKTYIFKFIDSELNNENQIIVEGPDSCIYRIFSPFVFNNRQPLESIEFKLVYLGINEKNGSIITRYFISFEDIITDFRALKRLTFDAFINSKIDSDKVVESELIKKFKNDYNNFENLWIISFCELLRNKINSTLISRDFSEALIFIDVLIKFEDWILESGFLNSFSSTTRFSTEKVAIKEIKDLKTELAAIEIILDSGENLFLNNLNALLDTETSTSKLDLDIEILTLLFKHEILVESLDHCNSRIRFIEKIRQKGLLKGKFHLFPEYNAYIERLQYRYQSRLFHQVFINEEKRNNFYNHNTDLFNYLYFIICCIKFYKEFNSLDHVIIYTIRLLRSYAHYIENKDHSQKILSIALKYSFLKKEDQVSLINQIDDDSIDANNIYNFFEYKLNEHINEENSLINEIYKRQETIKSKVVGDSIIGYLLNYNNLTFTLPYYNAPKRFKKNDSVECILYEYNVAVNQALAKIEIDKSKIPADQVIEPNSIIKAIVKGIEPYGIFVYIGNCDGLIPIKELSDNFISDSDILFNIGDVLDLKVLKVENEGDIQKITLSRKAYLAEFPPSPLVEGIYDLTIVSVNKHYGLFVISDYGHEGLIPVNEISWNDKEKFTLVFKIGDRIKAKYKGSKESHNYFSLKRLVKSPFFNDKIKLTNYKGIICKLNYFENWIKDNERILKPVFNDDFVKCYCPSCLQNSMAYYKPATNVKLQKSLIKRNSERFWQCTVCKFYQVEYFDVYIPDLKIFGIYKLSVISSDIYNRMKKNILVGDEVNLDIIELTTQKNEAYIIFNTSLIQRNTLQFEISNFKKYLAVEIAYLFESYGFLNNLFEERINNFNWARIFYSASKSSRSYFLNVFTNYIITLNDISDLTSYEEFTKKIELIKQQVSKFEVEKNSIEVFPEIEQIIIILNLLSHFGSKSSDALKYLLSHSVDSIYDNISIKSLASSILCFNLYIESLNQEFRIELWHNFIHSLKNTYTVFNSLESNFESKELVKSLIRRGERVDAEFKATLEVPVLSKEAKMDIERLEQLLKTSNSNENISKQLEKLRQVDVKNKKLCEQINFVAMKTIVAFANTLGGYLLIGVDEDYSGNPYIIGLNTTDLIKFGNTDNMMLRFDDLFHKYIGSAYQKALIEKVEFVTINNKIVLIIKVYKSYQPIFLQYNGEKKFYIRRQSSTVELSAFEMYEYLNQKDSN